jgi:phage protein U
VSNEHQSVLPRLGGPRSDNEHLLTLAVDGRPVALTDGHGQSVEWLGLRTGCLSGFGAG